MKTLLFLSSLIVSCLLEASALLEFPKTPLREVTRSDRQFSLPEIAFTKVAPSSVELKLMGAGVRKKKVVITSVDVYLIEHFQSPLSQPGKTKWKALRLTFLRNVPGSKIRNSFEETLKDNSVPVNESSISQALNFLSVDYEEKSEMILLGQTGEKAQTLWLETHGKTLKLESPQIVDQFWSIWFGKNTDDKLQELQDTLLKGFTS
jgi:hypothetical protein